MVGHDSISFGQDFSFHWTLAVTHGFICTPSFLGPESPSGGHMAVARRHNGYSIFPMGSASPEPSQFQGRREEGGPPWHSSINLAAVQA